MIDVPDPPAMAVYSEREYRLRYAWLVQQMTGCSEDEAARIASQVVDPPMILRGRVCNEQRSNKT